MYIPKIIHQIWVGSKTMTSDHVSWRRSWEHHNPQWFMMLWTDNEIERFKPKFSNVLSKCKNKAEMADILRIEILYRIGGLYVDVDFECLKPIDTLINNQKFLYIRQAHNRIGNAIMASVPGEEYITKLHDNIINRYNSHGDVDNSAHKFGPGYLTSLLPRRITIDKKVAYPYSWKEKHQQCENIRKSYPQAYAVHHWNQDWN